MRLMHRTLCAVALVALPGAAAAQAPAWIHDLADRLARSIEVRAAEIAAAAEQAVNDAQRDDARASARRAGRGQEFTEPFTRTVRLGSSGTLDLQNAAGDIVVTGGGGADVRIEALKRVRHPSEAQAKTILSALTIDVVERAGRVDVRTDFPRRRDWSGSVDFTVAMPRNASVTVRSVSGDVRVASVNGEIRLETVSGDVIVNDSGKVRRAKTVSGDIEIAGADTDQLTATSVSGDVIVRKLKAAGLDLETVSGDLRVREAEVERASLRSTSGDVEFGGRLSAAGRYEMQAHSGDIRFTPAGPRGFVVEARTFSGDIRSDFPLTLQGTTDGRGARTRSLRGSFGDAGPTLLLQSFSGDIVIAKP